MIRIRLAGAFDPAQPLREAVLSEALSAAPAVAAAAANAPDEILRLFDDDYLELVRLLREAAEIEHALMVQYLYAAFSVRQDLYGDIVGLPFPGADSLLGVAVQEMEHLRIVSDTLQVLGAAPNLSSQDFPFETDLYPFPLHLERLTDLSVAKYAYTEAPVGAVTPGPDNPDSAFAEALLARLGDIRPNHVGSVYAAIIGLAERVAASRPALAPQLAPQIDALKQVKGEGEDGHFPFFRSLFLATHPGFGGNAAVWALPPDDPAYPSLPLATDPSAVPGHPNQIPDARAFRLAAIGDLCYWAILLLLDMGYRYGGGAYVGQAKKLMTGPLFVLGRHLPALGYGLTFDPLETGYSPCRDEPSSRAFAVLVLESAQARAAAVPAGELPPGYPSGTVKSVADALKAMG